MNLPRSRRALNSVVLIVCLVVAAMSVFGDVMSLGTRYIDYLERGPFDLSQVSQRSLIRMCMVFAIFELPAFAAAVVFLFSRRRKIRNISAALAIGFMVLPVFCNPGIVVAIPMLPGNLRELLSAAISGDPHKGEWWGETLGFYDFGVRGLWLVVWASVLLLELKNPLIDADNGKVTGETEFQQE